VRIGNTALKLRLEYEAAGNQVINRGNYRTALFAQQGARDSFMDCTDKAAKKSGWVVQAWCLMSNRYHSVIETPQVNWVEGMTWPQANFALRFNCGRKETGHVCQGRYQSFESSDGREGEAIKRKRICAMGKV